MGQKKVYGIKRKKKLVSLWWSNLPTRVRSIGVTILSEDSEFKFMEAVEKALFTCWVDSKEWLAMSNEAKKIYIQSLADIREGMGVPVKINNTVIYNPDQLTS